MRETRRNHIALALDNVTTRDQIVDLIRRTSEWVGIYKVGLEQFTRFGPSILDLIRDTDRQIFLDLKFHDIPNTVAKAVLSACELGVDYLTIHTQGGVKMMEAAIEAAGSFSGGKKPKIIGVTLLTSLSGESLKEELCVNTGVSQYISHLLSMALEAGLNGVVCSAADLMEIRQSFPQNFEVITPGIRPLGSGAGDQKRVATPREAIERGATILVIGRPITGAQDPGKAAMNIFNQIMAVI
ncbi:MAG TPA: orotidine-5'-phosphate decarboxylase [Chitinispirillaceae bacterium]|nr:orotidine-5'-phosphate decarboxylase [Chitinispirillaceae bacterium]